MTDKLKTDLIEAIAQQLEKWFEERSTKVTVSRPKHTTIYDISISTSDSSCCFISASIRLFGGIVRVSHKSHFAYKHHTYELANPEFPENMFQDIHKAFQKGLHQQNPYT